MARGINKVILIGNLGRDPEVRYTAGGAAVASITVATSEKWRDKQTGQPQERTEWHRVVLFGRLGEIAAQYLRKGAHVYIEGRLKTREWEKDGVKRYTTEIIAYDMQMLSGGPGGSGEPDYGPARGGQGAPSGGAPAAGGDNFDDFDDDIPF